MLELEDEPSNARTESECKGHEDTGEAQVLGAILLTMEFAEVGVSVGGDA